MKDIIKPRHNSIVFHINKFGGKKNIQLTNPSKKQVNDQ